MSNGYNIDRSLSMLCEKATQMYFLIDANYNSVIYCNRACEQIFHDVTRPSQLLGDVHPDDRSYVIANFHACRAGSNIDNFQCRITVKDEIRYFKISALLLETDPQQSIIGVTAEDVTEVTKYIELLNNHNKKKNSILNIIAHDLMGPIGIIHAVSRLMTSATEVSSNSTLVKYVDMIDRTSNNCINLIRNFINQEFLQSAGVKLVKNRVDLISKMGALMEEYTNRDTTLQKKIKLESTNNPVYVEIDEDKFFQVINNLISNSLKFTPDGGLINISIVDKQATVLVSVADTGIGIPEIHQKHLFEEFTPARRSGLKGEESIGLGMSIIKTIVEWHEGKIWFQSEENQGTTFFIELPK